MREKPKKRAPPWNKSKPVDTARCLSLKGFIPGEQSWSKEVNPFLKNKG